MQGKELMVKEYGQVGPVAQADNDNQVLAMWLHGRPPTTQRAYAYEVQGLLAAVGKPLAQITLGDLQGYFSTLEALAPASRARAINAVKSLFSFRPEDRLPQLQPGAAIQAPKIKNTLAERILTGGPGSSTPGPGTAPPQPGFAPAPVCRRAPGE